MKLVLRVTIWIFLFLTISSSAIGYFAITKYHSSQLNIVDDSLNSKVKELTSTSEDPLTVAQYLAQVSAIPVSVFYISGSGTLTDLTVAGPPVSHAPSAAILSRASKRSVNFGKDLRIRNFEMSNSSRLLLVESLAMINEDVRKLTQELVLFIIFIDLFAGTVAFFLFRRDGKINEVSFLMAQQHVVMQKFLGDASHELRTPLTVIKGYVDLARNSNDSTKVSGYLEKSAKEIFRMESLIQDLLFLAEVGEVTDEQREPVDVGQIISEHLEVMEALDPLRKTTLELVPNSEMLADPRLIDRMIANIFSNIRRHTPRDAAIKATVSKSERELIISIEDGGPGLSEYPDKPRQIKRFTAQRSREGGGTGLGLSIITEIVERYQGTLSLEPSSLGGLRIKIIFVLP